MIVQAFINQKGGVGKTTLAYHAAHAAIAAGERVVVIDLDSQANISSMLRENYTVHASAKAFPDICFADALYGSESPDLSKSLDTPCGVRLFPAHRAMDVHDTVAVLAAVKRAQDAVATLDCDRVIVDCGPTMGLRQALSVALADQVIVPLEANALSISGVAGLQKLIEGVSVAVNKPREIQYVVNKVHKRSKLHAEAVSALKTRLSIRGILHDSSSLSRVPHATKPIWDLSATPSRTRDEWRSFFASLVNSTKTVSKESRHG
jgi:chromosome partitioning protein